MVIVKTFQKNIDTFVVMCYATKEKGVDFMQDDFAPSEYFDEDEKIFKYGKNFRKARKAANLTQIDAAKKIGIAVNSLRLYEADKRIPSVSVMSRMADAYEVTFNYLFTGKEYDLRDHPQTRLLNAFIKLNNLGKQKAVERVEELAEVKKYVLPAFLNAPKPPPQSSETDTTQGLEGSEEAKSPAGK